MKKPTVRFSWGDSPYTFIKRVIRKLRSTGRHKQATKLLEEITFAVLDDRNNSPHSPDFPGCGPGDIFLLAKKYVLTTQE